MLIHHFSCIQRCVAEPYGIVGLTAIQIIIPAIVYIKPELTVR